MMFFIYFLRYLFVLWLFYGDFFDFNVSECHNQFIKDGSKFRCEMMVK
jgi:hypothetical protein